MAKLRSLFLERTPTCVSDHHPKASERIGLRLIDFHRLHFRWLPRVRKGAVDAHVDVRRAIHENLGVGRFRSEERHVSAHTKRGGWACRRTSCECERFTLTL